LSQDNFKPEDFLEIGNELTNSLINKSSIDPSRIYYGYLRTAASRIYFGTFLIIREKMKELGESIPTGSRAHERITQLIEKYIDDGMHDLFLRFRIFRNHAEYDLPDVFKIRISMVIYWKNISERIINKVIKLSNAARS